MEPHVDRGPRPGGLIGCTCGATDCRHNRKLKAEVRSEQWAYLDHKAKLDALTDDDREWLTSHGWDGR